MANRVRVRTIDGLGWPGRIEDAETGKQIPGVRDIRINWPLGERPVATMDILCDFDIEADARFVPVFPRAGRCDSCQWWAHQGIEGTYGECLKARLQKPGDGVDAKFFISGTTDEFWTLADFGCVQWEPRQEDPGKDT